MNSHIKEHAQHLHTSRISLNIKVSLFDKIIIIAFIIHV